MHDYNNEMKKENDHNDVDGDDDVQRSNADFVNTKLVRNKPRNDILYTINEYPYPLFSKWSL